MSAMDTYTKYNSHSAAPYVGGMSKYAKKQGETSGRGKRQGRGETSERKCPEGISYTLIDTYDTYGMRNDD